MIKDFIGFTVPKNGFLFADTHEIEYFIYPIICGLWLF